MRGFNFLAKILIVFVLSICQLSSGYKLYGRHRRSIEGILLPSSFFERDFVSFHNSFRTQVHPQASNMKKMTWDNRLAEISATVAKKCQFAHSDASTRQHQLFGYVGENVFQGRESLSYIAKTALQRWFDEGKNYDYETSNCTKGECGHYLQLIWANSYKVGCAISYCQYLLKQNFGYLVVCEYGPGGNLFYLESDGRKVRVPPYSAGKPCAKCQANETCENGLCVVP